MPAFTTHLVSPWGGNINQKMPPIGETEGRDDVEFDEYYICNAEGISFAEAWGCGGEARVRNGVGLTRDDLVQ